MKQKGFLILSALTIFGLVGCSAFSSTTDNNDEGGVVTPTSPVPVEDDSSNQDDVGGGDEEEIDDGSSSSSLTKKISLGSGAARLSILSSTTVTPTFTNTIEEDLIIGEYDTSKILVEQANDGNHSITFTVLQGDANETVVLSNSEGIEVSYIVMGRSNEYSKTSDEDSWFNDLTISSLDTSLKEDMPIGIDISFVKQIYDAGGHYYNKDGEEENLFKIIKDAGYNTVRIKEFVDPYNYEIGDEPVTYGGGTNDLETNLWIAKFANLYDLDIMIDLHYSDFYADPDKQIIPKAWADATSSSEMITYISNYTKETLQAYKDAGIDVTYVQIGNETTTGLLWQKPGADYSYLTGDNPGYTTNRTTASTSIGGNYYNSTTNFVNYINAGVTAAKSVFSNIQTIVHVAREYTYTSFYTSYYNTLKDVDYDIIGISGYIYHQGMPNESGLGNILTLLENNFPTKKVMVVESAYGFTTKSNANASNIFNSTEEYYYEGYDISPTGQASIMRDTLNVLNNHSNGYGYFYWGGEFVPVSGSGRADSLTKSSWANQALFSYDGKALPSLYFLNNL